MLKFLNNLLFYFEADISLLLSVCVEKWSDCVMASISFIKFTHIYPPTSCLQDIKYKIKLESPLLYLPLLLHDWRDTVQSTQYFNCSSYILRFNVWFLWWANISLFRENFEPRNYKGWNDTEFIRNMNNFYKRLSNTNIGYKDFLFTK